jgi:glycosyltransferase involved in cell wall biosynthesis
VGKYSVAKGIVSLLDAFEALREAYHPLEFHVAGSGSGDEASGIESRMRSTPGLVLHGMLGQPALADLMRTCDVCVLPSFYEGVPLVLVEALACGCRLVATRLPGVTEQITPHAHPFMHLVDLPAMRSIDVPDPKGLPGFVDSIVEAISTALDAPPAADDPHTLGVAIAPFGWRAVFGRVARMYNEVAREREGARA